jgi:hypothetical protein
MELAERGVSDEASDYQPFHRTTGLTPAPKDEEQQRRQPVLSRRLA